MALGEELPRYVSGMTWKMRLVSCHPFILYADSAKQVLLVSSSRTPEKWIVPGGGIEPNEDSVEAAVREVMEEAGVRGILSRSLGQFENLERKHRTSVYVLVVTEELEEWDDKSIGRKRKWFNIEEALELLVSMLKMTNP